MAPAAARAPERRPPDQPRAIRRIVATHTPTDPQGRPTGPPEPVTVADRIVADVRTGVYLETAAAHAGIDKVTLHRWLKDGARAAAKYHAGQTAWGKLTAYERECVVLCNRVDEALAESELHDVAQLAQLARGGRQVRTTTRKVQRVEGAEVEVERTERTEELAPNPHAITWRLERRFPARWGRRQQVEVSGEIDLGDARVESPVEQLLAKLAEIAMRRSAIDVGAVEVPAIGRAGGGADGEAT